MLTINYYHWELFPKAIIGLVQRIVRQTYRQLKLSFPVSIIIADQKTIKLLNYQYRQKNKVTDVLSFYYPEKKGYEEGEIYICRQQLIRQAQERGVTVSYEASKLVVHGLVHLAGYDHEKKKDYIIMEKLEEKLLKYFVHEF
ncbi:MAG: rRNA maturation RNase YbeY [Candidatus Komeilibacteria bacterium CG_4_10_14_0_2_um_filter_37_10]|uniref:Endoribonuclease YbeY n=1 Tax=Candidatus Komeilibacteria bacterium CG_4_10_14_0_2_um_filter_37_10 TaxID=1974470 RepID=A0A2M7VDH3_9BACT|nr:MAG: rRNA maturation RNase YbeY [Candidatus Komeilibacteria bacterium CG_4_10_14_0_2_um_filter_37_10]PJA92619.1 MAG: rRNA maturation RNase YbeY [Candidatus Komeilibacteria bacterium CG_4_9_14_3_um_filter_37_5]